MKEIQCVRDCVFNIYMDNFECTLSEIRFFHLREMKIALVSQLYSNLAKVIKRSLYERVEQ